MVTTTPQTSWSEAETADASDREKSFSWSDFFTPAAIAGIADAGVVLLFVTGMNVSWGLSRKLELWYLFITVAKVVLVAISWNRRAPLTTPAKWLLGSTATMALATTITGFGGFGPYIAVGAFLVHLVLTSTLIGRAPLRQYLLGPVALISSTALLHAVMCLAHKIPAWFGRYLYFGYNQFNLGGEIEAVGCLTAALLLPRLLAAPVIGILLFDMNLMQARSGMLAGFATLVVVLTFDGHRRLTQQRVLALAFLAPIGGLLLAVVGAGGKLADTISDIFLLNDAHRGIASGGSGRTDLWDWSIQLFNESPLVGHDLSYFDSIGFIGSHNIFLYGLAQYGLMSLLFFGTLVYSYVSMARRDFYRFSVLIAALPLLLFNDRFTNLNPYPFIFFILLTSGAQRAREPT